MKLPQHISTVLKTAVLAMITLCGSGRAAVYQWSIPQEPGRRAYLWIPEKCQRIRGLVVDMNNLTESAIIENAVVREACAQERVGILWIAEGSWAASPLANEWGDLSGLSKEQQKIYNDALEIAKKAGKQPTLAQVQAQATVKTMKLELARQAEEELNNMLKGLAKESGYEEVERAPLLIIGHSMTGLITWAMPYWIPERMWGAVPMTTGVRGAPWENPDAKMTGVPVLYMNQTEPEGPDAKSVPRNYSFGPRQNTANLAAQVFDWGGTHFEISDEMAKLFALFVHKASKYRLADEIPATGYPKLKELKAEQGWLATALLDPQQFLMAPEPQYKGDKTKAFWFFDEEMAKAVVSHHIEDRKKKTQYVTVVSNGQKLKPLTGAFDSVKIPFESGIDDGFTFKLTGAFLDTVPSKNPAEAKPAGHAASGKVLVKIAGGGSLAQLSEDTFRFRPGNMGFNGKALNCWMVATHPGDGEYARCNQHAWLWMPEKLTQGVAQTITFGKPDNVIAGTKEITLDASASSGLPVEYYVVSGPAEVVGNKLRFTPIPPHAKMPVKVIVTAYQMGRTTTPLTQSAKPVEQSFLIITSQKDLALQLQEPAFVPPSSKMPVLAAPAAPTAVGTPAPAAPVSTSKPACVGSLVLAVFDACKVVAEDFMPSCQVQLGTVLNGQTSGKGWTGAWTGSPAFTVLASADAAKQQSPLPACIQAKTPGANAEPITLSRSLCTPIKKGTEFWLQFYAKSTGWGLSTSGIGLLDASGKLLAGVSRDGNEYEKDGNKYWGSLRLFDAGGSAGKNISPGGGWSIANQYEWHRILMRLTWATDGKATLHAWVDPNGTTGLNDPGAVLQADIPSDIAQIQLRAGDFWNYNESTPLLSSLSIRVKP